jgi:hypothetical protein
LGFDLVGYHIVGYAEFAFEVERALFDDLSEDCGLGCLGRVLNEQDHMALVVLPATSGSAGHLGVLGG